MESKLLQQTWQTRTHVSMQHRPLYRYDQRRCWHTRSSRAAIVARSQTQQETVQGSSYEEIIDSLAHRAAAALKQKPHSQHIIGIAGAPGSGKSTLSTLVCKRINELYASQDKPVAVVVPMDGFHYYKRELDQMPDPVEAYARRGAHWTFDAAAFVECVRGIRQRGEASVPSFDHGVGDPVPDDIQVLRSHHIVLVEGNYLLLEEQPWRQLRELFDDTWFADCPVDTAMDRVFQRQVAIGLAPEVSKGRIAGNDRLNGEQVAATRGHARLLVPSTVPFKAAA